MISRLLLTTAIGFALSTAAFAQGTTGPSATDSNMPATVTLSEGVSVTEQDRARIGEFVARMNVKSLRGVDFSVSAGAKVPRELRVHRLPTEVGQIVPQYRDYRFLVVEKAIVIVEPKANKIVAVLKPDSGATATATNAPPAAPTPAAPAKTIPAPVAEAPITPAPVATAPVTATPASTVFAPAITTPAVAAPAASTPTPSPAAATAEQPAAPTRESAAEPERPKVKKQAARSQRRTVSRAERDEWRRSNAEVRVGQRVPDDVVLHRVPPRYYQEVPVTREYRNRGYAGTWRGRPVYQEFD